MKIDISVASIWSSDLRWIGAQKFGEIHCSWSALPKSLKAVLPKSVRNSAVLHLFVGFSDYFEVGQGAEKVKRNKIKDK